MIARFFKTSKPIHFVIVLMYLLIMFVITRFNDTNTVFNIEFVNTIFIFLVLVTTVFVLDFLVKKNDLTQKNSYKTLVFVILLAAFSKTLIDNNIIVANFFILLSLRRLISIRSRLKVKKKLFDAAFWIAVASLFYFWSVLFLILIFIALLLHSVTQIKNWIVPLTGVFTVIIIVIAYQLLTNNDVEELYHFISFVDFNFSRYLEKNTLIVLIIIGSISLWTIFTFLLRLSEYARTKRPSFIIIAIALLIGVSIIVISPSKTTSELLFCFAPLSIIITNYLEHLQKNWIAEILIWVLLCMPIIYII